MTESPLDKLYRRHGTSRKEQLGESEVLNTPYVIVVDGAGNYNNLPQSEVEKARQEEANRQANMSLALRKFQEREQAKMSKPKEKV